MIRIAASSPQRRQLTGEAGPHIRRCLQRRVNTQRALIAAMMLFGIPLLAVGPAVAATFIIILDARYGKGDLTFSAYFWNCAWIVVPILFFLEMKTKGTFAEKAGISLDEFDPRLSLLSGSTGAELVVLVIFSLLGPGLILGAAKRIRGQLINRAAPMARCTEVVAQLLQADIGVSIFHLQKSGELFEDLLTVIEYLVHYEWASASKSGDKVWILSDAKNRLARAAT